MTPQQIFQEATQLKLVYPRTVANQREAKGNKAYDYQKAIK